MRIMADRERITFSLEPELAKRLERTVKRSRYGNRSKFICDLIHRHLTEEACADDRETLGTITLVYDHHRRTLRDALLTAQHEHHDLILCTTHVHLTHHHCAEAILVRGPAEKIRALADALGRIVGVIQASLSMSAASEDLVPRRRAHRH